MAYKKDKIKKIVFCMSVFLLVYVLIVFVALNKNLRKCEDTYIVRQNSITVALDWTPNTNHTGLYVAKELGYFHEEGINVNIFQPQQGGATLLVASGKAQFGVDFQDFLAPAFAVTPAIPVKAVAAITQHNTSGIISRKDKGILSPKDMEYKSYATWDNPMEQTFLKYLMKKQGAEFSRVNLIHASIDNLPVALKYNIDCAWGYYGIEAIATQIYGVGCNFFFFKDIDPILDYYAPVIIANDEFTKQYPEVTKKFLKALSRGYVFSVQNPKAAAQVLLKYVPELNKDLITTSQRWISQKYIEDSPVWGIIDEVRWNCFFSWLYQEKIINVDITKKETFTNEFLPETIKK